MSSNKWIIYEREKKKIQAKCLTTKEYEREIRKLADKLRI
jgi:hypothetical protein